MTSDTPSGPSQTAPIGINESPRTLKHDSEVGSLNPLTFANLFRAFRRLQRNRGSSVDDVTYTTHQDEAEGRILKLSVRLSEHFSG